MKMTNARLHARSECGDRQYNFHNATTVAWHRSGGSAIIPVGYCTKIDRAVDASSISSECRQLVVLASYLYTGVRQASRWPQLEHA